MIKVKYTSVDRYRSTRTFKTLKGARKFAQDRIGKNPDIGSYYAVSFDGIGKIEVSVGTHHADVKLADLFGDDKKPGGLPDGEFKIYIVHPIDKWFMTRAEAEAEIKALIERDPKHVYGPYEIQEDTMRKEDLNR